MSIIFFTAAVSAILQGYGGGHRVTDASAELHRLCGCLEQLLQVGLCPLPSPPCSTGPDNQEGFPRSLGKSQNPSFAAVHHFILLSQQVLPDI